MDRREFIGKLTGMAAAGAVAAVGLESCHRSTSSSSDDSTSIAEGEMTYRTSTHGDKVSLLGYGCMRWPSRPGRFAPDENEIDQEEVNRLVDYAIEHGVNFFDCSPVYCKGFSEEATGIALSRHPRDKYFISTKLSNFSAATWSREESMRLYHESMEKLRVDYLDYYLLHAVGGGQDAFQRFRERYIDNGMLEFLLEERKAGRIRHLGFSYHGDVRVFDYLLAQNDQYHWDMCLIQLNYVDWRYAKDMDEDNTNAEYLLGELRKKGIPAMVMEPLLGGQLAQLPAHATRVLKERDPEASIPSWAFRFAGSQEGVMTVLSGMTYMEHLKDNLHTFSPLHPLDEEDERILMRLAEEYAHFPLVPCTSCNYCMPCPYGIDIPANFRHYNASLNNGRILTNQQDPDYKRLRREYLITMGERIERERQADHCIGCGECMDRCPQSIDIVEQMRKIANLRF